MMKGTHGAISTASEPDQTPHSSISEMVARHCHCHDPTIPLVGDHHAAATFAGIDWLRTCSLAGSCRLLCGSTGLSSLSWDWFMHGQRNAGCCDGWLDHSIDI